MSSTHSIISSGGEEAGGVSGHLSSITGGVLRGLGDNPEVPPAPSLLGQRSMGSGG